MATELSSKFREPVAKVCATCGIDVSKQRRVKDSRGRYFCEPCRETKGAQRQQREVMPPSEAGLDDLAALARPASDPALHEEMPLLTCSVCGGRFTYVDVHNLDGAVVCKSCQSRGSSVTTRSTSVAPRQQNGLSEANRLGLEKLWAQIPTFRKGGFCDALMLLGLFTVAHTVLIVWLIMLTGPVYKKQLDEQGNLKTWGGKEQIVPLLMLFFIIAVWIFALVTSNR